MLSLDLAVNRQATNSLCGIRQETYLSLGPVARTGYAATGPHPVQRRVLEAMRHHATGDARLEQLLAANHGETFSPATGSDARGVSWPLRALLQPSRRRSVPAVPAVLCRGGQVLQSSRVGAGKVWIECVSSHTQHSAACQYANRRALEGEFERLALCQGRGNVDLVAGPT